MKASFLDLRKNMKDVLRAMEKNELVTLTYRGKVKGVIKPVNNRNSKNPSSHPAFGIWKDHENMRDVVETIDRLRKGRFDAV